MSWSDLKPELTRRHFACRVYHSYFHYLRVHFPNLDLEKLCLDAGLPLAYLEDESNWVSVEFDQRFTQACIDATGLPDLCYRVGEQAVSPEVMGKVVNFVLKYTFSVSRIYTILPSLTSVFSKVTEVVIVKKGQTYVNLKLRIRSEGLTLNEQEALQKNLPNIIQNTIGHYSSLPTIHQLPKARIEWAEVSGDGIFPEYLLNVDYSKSMALSFSAFIPLIAICVATFGLDFKAILAGSVVHILASLLIVSLTACGALLYRYRAAQRGLSETVDSLRGLDQRYESLQRAKEYAQTLSKAYGRFVPRDFLQYLHRDSIVDVRFGDHVEGEMTVLFADLRDFTAQAETWSPKETFNYLNAHLARISPIISQYGGFIDKYIGDCVMAVFPNDASSAVAAAIEMIRCSEDYNRERVSQGRRPFKMGIGINTGRLIFGTVGYSDYMQGTVISDAVNLASRLEGLSKRLGAPIVVGEATIQKLKSNDKYRYRPLGLVSIRGREEKVRVFEVFSDVSDLQEEILSLTQNSFEEALAAIEAEQYTIATLHLLNVLHSNPNDLAAKYHLQKIRELYVESEFEKAG